MARQRRSKGLTLDDLAEAFRSVPAALVMMAFGAALMLYHVLTEPSRGDPARPMSMLVHASWEGLAVRSFWPGLGLFVLGCVGLLYLTIVDQLRSD